MSGLERGFDLAHPPTRWADAIGPLGHPEARQIQRALFEFIDEVLRDRERGLERPLSEYLARYLLIRPGDTYSGAQLARQRQALSKSGHFQGVEILPLPANADQPPAIPLRIRLEPLKPNRFRGGLGWGTDTDFGAQLDWTRRYVGGRGQRFTLGGAVVQERRKLAADLRYQIPLQPLAESRIELVARQLPEPDNMV